MHTITHTHKQTHTHTQQHKYNITAAHAQSCPSLREAQQKSRRGQRIKHGCHGAVDLSRGRQGGSGSRSAGRAQRARPPTAIAAVAGPRRRRRLLRVQESLPRA